MTVLAPPQPAHDCLDALIEEARERARRRRLAYGAVAALALVLGAGVLATRSLIGGGRTSAVPTRSSLAVNRVQAGGPVEHWLAEPLGLGRPSTIDLAVRRVRPTAVRLENWWDAKTSLWRQVTSYDGRIVDVDVFQTCRRASPPRGCFSPTPWAEAGRC